MSGPCCRPGTRPSQRGLPENPGISADIGTRCRVPPQGGLYPPGVLWDPWGDGAVGPPVWSALPLRGLDGGNPMRRPLTSIGACS